MFQKILLATDGSAASERAADFAASLAKHYHASIVVLHAFVPPHDYLGEPNYQRALDGALDHSKSLVANVAKRLRDLDVDKVDTDIVPAPATTAILDAAHVQKPDLIVMGARGLGTWQGVILGSVSMAVTQRAECPVLIVK